MRLTVEIPDDMITHGQAKALRAADGAVLLIELKDGTGLIFTCEATRPATRFDLINLRSLEISRAGIVKGSD